MGLLNMCCVVSVQVQSKATVINIFCEGTGKTRTKKWNWEMGNGGNGKRRKWEMGMGIFLKSHIHCPSNRVGSEDCTVVGENH